MPSTASPKIGWLALALVLVLRRLGSSDFDFERLGEGGAELRLEEEPRSSLEFSALSADSRRRLAGGSGDSQVKRRGERLTLELFRLTNFGNPGRPGDDSGDGPNGESSLRMEYDLERDERLPIFSISRCLPRFCPRGVVGTDEFLSSLPRVELGSEAAAFFFGEIVVNPRAVRFRGCFVSFLSFLASSLFESLNLRR